MDELIVPEQLQHFQTEAISRGRRKKPGKICANYHITLFYAMPLNESERKSEARSREKSDQILSV